MNGSNGNDDHDGLTPATAKLSIGNATGTANTGDTVHIADGIYTGPGNTGITIDKNMTITGESRDRTIINGTNTTQIFYIPTGVTVTLENLTLTQGKAHDGGAILNEGTVTINNSNLTYNTGNINGGAIRNSGTVTINNSTINHNKAENGAAIFNEGTVTITNSNLNNNTAADTGGAISTTGGTTVIITNSNLNNNTATNGGAINNYFATLSITNSNLNNNTVTENGGAINNQAGTVTITNSNLNNNTATENGGAIHNQAGTVTITNSNLNNNTATENGGAIDSSFGSLNVHYSSLVGNTAPTGNAIYCPTGTADARFNWWGSNSSPSGNLAGSVNFDPWLILTINVNPSSINYNGTGTIVADLLHDSSAEHTYHDPADGCVPDGIPINLTTDWGNIKNIIPATSTTLNGKVEATYQADGALPIPLDPVKIYANADTENVYKEVIIVKPTITTVDALQNYAGETVNLKAHVKDNSNRPVNEGQIQFKVNNVTAGTVNVKNGVASLNWKIPSNWKANKYTIIAEYLGTTNYIASSGTSTLTLKPTAIPVFILTVSKGTYYYGEIVHYYVTVKNNGPDSAIFSLYDKLPPGLKYLGSTATRGSYKSNTWTIGTLKPGQTAKLEIKAVVNKIGIITNKATLTESTLKGPAAIIWVSFNVPKAVPLSELIKASSQIKAYSESHNYKLPASLKVAGQTLTMAQLLKLLTTATINISKKNLKPISVTSAGKAPSPGGRYISGGLYNYLSVAKNIQTFINKKGRAPNYAVTRLGNIPFSRLVYMYAKVINFYGQQKRLPNWVATYKI